MKIVVEFSLLAWVGNATARRVVAGLFITTVLSGTGALYAAEEVKTITKSVTPTIVNVQSNGGTGLARFSLLTVDFPEGRLYDPRKLEGIEWRTTYYPPGIEEDVVLCYHPPYSLYQEECVKIQPNSTGTLLNFNAQRFGHGSTATIKHYVNGSARIAKPLGEDSVTFRFRH